MTIGILGGGQLGRMLILAGIPLGLRFRVLDPVREAATDGLAERVTGEFEDFAALAEFVPGLDAVTYEFENVPVATTEWLAERVPVFPPPAALAIAQDRIAEKQFFTSLQIPTPAYRAVSDRGSFDAAIVGIGLPAVLKTRRFGYDGKGQAVIRHRDEIEPAWSALAGRPLILEQFMPFERELSIIAVRERSGTTAFYPLSENEHHQGILARSIAPALGIERGLQSTAESHATRALTELHYVGVLAIEFFDVAGRLVANEMAPRVHNSGHWTIEGAATSQFENHVRAVAGWPLGTTEANGVSAMLNLIGDLPETANALEVPGTHLHLYGKAPRPRRKVGHITITAADREQLMERVNRCRAILAAT